MKKRFFNALLLGAVLLSTNVVTSCKDYDDDINSLQSQIDKLATAEQLKSEIATLSSAVTAAKAEAIAEANKALEAAKAAQATADKAATKEQLEELRKAVEAADAAAKKAQEDLATAKANLEELIAKKADQSALDEANTKIALAQVAIAENKAAAAAAQAAAEGAKADAAQALADAKAAIAEAKTALETDIAKKADQTALDAAVSRITALEDFVGNLEDLKSKSLDAVVSEKIAEIVLDASNKESLAGRVAALESLVSSMEDGSIALNIQGLQESLDELKKEAEAIIGAYSAMVTNVSLVTSMQKVFTLAFNSNSLRLYNFYDKDNFEKISEVWGSSYSLNYTVDNRLGFTVAGEQDNVFPASKDDVDKQLEFKKGSYTVKGDMLLVRVNPTNAILKKEDISLINSQGKELTDIIECTDVKPYEGLLTRSAGEGNGLWVITYNLKKEFEQKALDAAMTEKGRQILYAVSVNTSKADVENGEKQLVSENRRVVSEYDVTLGTSPANMAYDFKVNDKSVRSIHNRFRSSESSGRLTDHVKELNWKDAPAVSANDKNTVNKLPGWNGYDDNRQNEKTLAVVMGEDITIEYPNPELNPIKGFYVTLDYAFAIGDGGTDVSEINAWNSYEYENVGTFEFKGFEKTGVKTPAKMFEGNVGTIKINNMNNVRGDIIGFRVYAVNLDGTLVDPDGRAFYVALGDAVEDGSFGPKDDVASTITPNKAADGKYLTSGKSIIRSVEKDGLKFNKNLSTWGYEDEYGNINYYRWLTSKDNPNKTSAPAVTVQFFEDENGTNPIQPWNLAAAIKNDKAKYYQIVVDNLADYIDNGEYTQTMTTFDQVNGANIPVQTVTFKWKKVLPTAFPANFAFRTAQETTAGSGEFIAYMYPNKDNSQDYRVDSNRGFGYKDMNNIFFGLDKNYVFSLATSQKVNGKDATLDVYYNDNSYVFAVANEYIKDMKHDVTVSYNYGPISTVIENGKVKTQDHKVNYGKTLKVTYACWAGVNKYAWVQNADITNGLQWSAEGTTAKVVTDMISVTNGYNNDFFGKSLWKLIDEINFLEIDGEPELLSADGQKNPYFVPAFTADRDAIIFTQNNTQIDTNPTADHEETLIFYVKDCFGHKNKVELKVNILKAKAVN